MYTRQDYLSHKCTHSEYYSQFVTSHTLKLVNDIFGKDHLKECYTKDQNLNNIPLYKWDNLALFVNCDKALKECGDFSSLAGKVCILKESAKILISEDK
jgi:hypothetical protein